jgi:hypothetical protein
VGGRRVASLGGSFIREHLLPDLHHFALFGQDADDFPVKRRRKLDGGFVCHDLAQGLVVFHCIPDLDLPFDELALVYAFT